MLRLLTPALLLMWCVVPARADMTLFLREVGNDVELHLRGSIDTSASVSLAHATSTGGLFTLQESPIATRTGARGVGRWSAIMSGAPAGDSYRFADDLAFTTIGTRPPSVRFPLTFNTNPSFWFGFFDTTQTFGDSGEIRDQFYLPDGYVSSELVSFDYVASNTSFGNFGISLGDRWGVSFSGGQSGAQVMLFHVIPEPSTLLLLAIAPVFVARKFGL